MALGSAHMTTTTQAQWLPIIWTKETTRTREQNLVLAKLIKRVDKEVVTMGSAVYIPNSTALSASTKTANTEITVASTTEDKTTVTINQHKYVAQLLEDMVAAQSIVDAVKEIRWAIGYGLAVDLDDYIASLVQSSTWTTTAVGNESGDPAKADFISAVQQLDESNAPMNDRHGVLAPKVWASAINIDEFSRANSIAFSQTNSPLVTWKMAPVYGIDWNKSTNVVNSGSVLYNAVFHRDAIACAVQKEPLIEKSREARFLGDLYIGSHLYGASQLRSDHLVVMKSAE